MGHSWRDGRGQKALQERSDLSGGPLGGQGVVLRPSRLAGSSPEPLGVLVGQNWVRAPPAGLEVGQSPSLWLGVVGRLSRRDGSGWKALLAGQEWSGGPSSGSGGPPDGLGDPTGG